MAQTINLRTENGRASLRARGPMKAIVADYPFAVVDAVPDLRAPLAQWCQEPRIVMRPMTRGVWRRWL